MTDPELTHVVVSAPSQWGQQACDHLLHRAVANGGRVTLMVPRRDQERFEKSPPSIKEWKHHTSLKACLEQLRASGRPIDYLYDDHANSLAATLISQRKSGRHLTVGYVTSSAEDHLAHARYLSQFCDRVLVEKPVSRIFSEIQPGGEFSKLVRQAAEEKQKCRLTTAEHYLFRPGVTSALKSGLLEKFLTRHQKCNLRYQFYFTEPASRDNPEKRLSSYQDGSILDVLAPHGLGPVARLFVPILDVQAQEIDFHEHLTWHRVRSWQATEPNGSLTVPVLAETAAELLGSLRLPTGQSLHLQLFSAKGCRRGLRYFKFSCPIAECCHIGENQGQVLRDLGVRSGTAEACLYFGVSLGSAGFTVLDYRDPAKRLFEEFDGGYESDTRGSNSEAANAQASMLDALLGQEFAQEKGRFVPVESACQLVRSGIQAQGIAFNRKPSKYVWGTETEWATQDEEDLAEIELRPLRHFSPGIEQLAEVLSLAGKTPSRGKPYHRVVTILGAEGEGNSDIARALSKDLCALHINIPRDEAWDRPQPGSVAVESSSPSRFTLETVLRDLATQLQLPVTTARCPDEELLDYLRRVGENLPGKEILLFNGVDRLPSPDWCALVRILNHLSPDQRMIFVTKKWERSAGFVVRTEELMGALKTPEIRRLKKPPLEEYFPPAIEIDKVIRNRYWKLWEKILLPFSRDNLTVRQQLASYIFYIALPAALQKQCANLPQDAWWDFDPGKVNWRPLQEHVRGEIASLDLPTPLVSFPEAFLDRLSLLCLAMVGEEDRAAVRSLAALSGPIPRELIEEVRPGLFPRFEQLQPVRALFEKVEEGQALLFPRVRRAALTYQPEQLVQLRAEIERRRLILALRRLRSSSPDRRPLDEQIIRLLYGASLERLNLDESPFEACCMELIEGLETSSDLHGEQSAGSVLELLTGSSSLKTNLGLLAQARFTHLKGLLLCRAAGTDPALLNQATEVLDHALALAQYCAYKKGDSREQKRQARETLVLTIQGRVLAGLIQIRCWHRLLGVKTTPWVEKQDWERFVMTDQANDEQSLWKLCGIDVCGDVVKKPSDLSDKTVAASARLLALYTAALKRGWAPERPILLCLAAAGLHDGNEEDCRARILLEAAFMLTDDQSIEDQWNLNASGGCLTRNFLRDKAKEILMKEREAHPGLALYMGFLDQILEVRSKGVSLFPADKELARFEVEFERAGEAYFTQLVRDMRALEQN